ncbi:hypothetical protein KAR91_47490 [Candidatus Pacearchaeota archaeon]|nr:hypothetical protein [Candidatus Pacearchaeota archaeon]
MDIFDFEELTAEMLDVTDDQREDDDFLPVKFYEEFNIEFEDAYEFTKRLLPHTIPVESGLSGKSFYVFVSKDAPVTLMKIEAGDLK